MAARRLVMVMVVMLVISTIAAALAPPRDEDEEDGATTTTETTNETAGETAGEKRSAERPDDRPAGGGRLLTARIRTGKRIAVVPVRLGDQLRLEVISPAPGELEIPALGLTDYAGPEAPARFDVLAERLGEFEIRRLQARTVVARIEVKPR